MATHDHSSNVTSDVPVEQTTPFTSTDDQLLEMLNEEMRTAVMPVSIFVGILIFFGFFGNIFVLYVFIKRYHDCNFRYFVLCLALLDFISTLTTMPGEILTQQFWYMYPDHTEICKVKSFFNVFTVSGEALCLLTIAVDRYLKVCRPFGRQIKPKRAMILCVVIYVVAFILSIPAILMWGVQHREQEFRGRTIEVRLCLKDEKYTDTSQPFAYVTSVESFVGLCLVLMFVLYMFVAKKLILGQKATEQRRQTSNSPMTHTRATLSPNIIATSHPESSDVGIGSDFPTQEGVSATNFSKTDTTQSTDEESGAVDIADVVRSQTQSHPRRGRSIAHRNRARASRVSRKTLIMFILTITFIVTTILYLTLLLFISSPGDILRNMNNPSKAAYFFFFRLVFINHCINPLVYGCLDPHFKQVLGDIKMYILKKVGKGNNTKLL